MLRARGASPVALPVIALHPPRDPAAVERALARLGSYTWVAFTSINGVTWTWAALERMGKDASAFAGAKVAAIGPGTASALSERGVTASVVALEHKGEGLAAALASAMRAGESLLLLRAQVARDVLPSALREAGHTVDDVAVYETRAASGQDVAGVLDELAKGAIDAVTFTSPSTVYHFVALAGGAPGARALLDKTCVASIGPVTSAALVAHGLRADAEAGEHSFPGLLEALAAALGNPRSPRSA
jgi:uroporphyrinogen III methyltransferase/synthase